MPVAVSEDCHFPEIQEVGAGEVFPLEGQAVAEALERILTASTLQQRKMGRAGRHYVEEHLTWEHIGQRTIQEYRNVLKR